MIDERGTDDSLASQDIAIIAMAGRFPQAPDIETFWRNLVDGRECVRHFTEQELTDAGYWDVVRDIPGYVPARAIIDDPEYFDAGFFGFSPAEAKATDPQHRMFLEVAWEAMERAGYDPRRYAGLIGVYAGVDVASYAAGQLGVWTHDLPRLIGNDKDYMATRVAYKMGLRGPAVMIQTACSTSLVAVQHACQSLLGYQCDMAMAGGVGIAFPQKGGYVYQEGGILSPDGHCRPFDARAQGTVGGDGCGIVVLKRLQDAVADGDHVHAVIKSAAINNDGSDKIGFTAPSISGQAEVIAMALEVAGVHPDTIGYVEAHGTATQLGDAIEVAALTEAWRARTGRRGFCALGSVKSNMGHMNSAAGVGGLIKAALCVERGIIPGSLHFETPNPALDLPASPFFVAAETLEWKRGDHPRRAAVSSFGVGGTNAHAVLEEAPEARPGSPSRRTQPLVLSARSAVALDQATQALRVHLQANPDVPLADVAFTLLTGRKRFEHRRVLACSDTSAAVAALASPPPAIQVEEARRTVVFMLPGQGAQYPGMTRGLHEREPRYRAVIDECCAYLQGRIGVDLRTLILGDPDAAAALNQTAHTQPALFVVEYALARLLESWGVRPDALIGHSVGEYVAACLAGVFTVEQALDLLAARGRLIGELPGGGMLAVSSGEAEAATAPGLSIGAVNAPDLTVLTGPDEAIDAAARAFKAQGVGCTRLHTSHAFHSSMMDPILDRFREVVARIPLRAPQLPFISNVTGTWITGEEATDPSYWVQHLRRPVQFSEGVRTLRSQAAPLFVEVGPGRNLSGLVVRQDPALRGRVVTTVRHQREVEDDGDVIVQGLARLYAEGADVDWAAFYDGERRRRVPLPSYPFQRERYWEERFATSVDAGPAVPHALPESDWVTTPGWQRALAPVGAATPVGGSTLVLLPGHACHRALVEGLDRQWDAVIEVRRGTEFRQLDDATYELDPARREHWKNLVDLVDGAAPVTVLHLWSLGGEGDGAQAPEDGLNTLLRLGQVLGDRASEVIIATRGTADVTGDERLRPELFPMLAAARILPQEISTLRCRVVDTQGDEDLRIALKAELGQDGPAHVAYRRGQRWIESYAPAGHAIPDSATGLREQGVYLITGGLGTIGLALAGHLATRVRARLVLTSRSGLVAREDWDDWLATHRDDDPQSMRIKRIRGMEAAGAQVEVMSADVADGDRMRHVLTRTRERFGVLHGVFHAAGTAGMQAFRAIADTEPEHVRSQFRARVQGCQMLAEVLPADLDFVLLVSSLSTVVGGAGLLAYAAANHFVDGIASATGAPWASVSMDAWAPAAPGAPAASGVPPDRGVDLLSRIASRPDARRWVVSTVPLERRLREAARARSDAAPRPATGAPAQRHPRPELGNPFVAPRDDLEKAVAAIWEEVLGIDGIGVQDSFFKLGGDSLMAIQIGTRLRDTMDVEIQMNELFMDPTVAGVAGAVARARSAAGSTAQAFADKLELVESLSDEDVSRMLAELEARP